ncbi:hypothetical protein EIK77_010333 [Talaromyces pinophilus]|nr:hypothetical protein EIK77_010333 [Talaromyces pinophilus]
MLNDLTQEHPMFEENNPGRNIVITSYQTLTQRHGPKVQLRWQIRNNRPHDIDKPDPSWPKCLADRFAVMVCDEVHNIRNTDTQGYRTIEWLKAKFHVLLSATPSFNSISDLKGMLSLMVNPKNGEWWANANVPKNYDPLFDHNQEDPNFRLLFTPKGLKKWVWDRSNLSSSAKALALMPIWKRCVIRRLVTSKIPLHTGPLIGDHIPPAIRKIVSVQFGAKEQEQYNLLAAEPLQTLVFFNDRAGKAMWRADKYRMLTLLGTWLGSQYIQDALMAKDTERHVRKLDDDGSLGKWMVHYCLTIIRNLAKTTKGKARQQGDLIDEAVNSIPKLPRDYQEMDRLTCLLYLLSGSPKLRAWLRNVQYEVFVLGEKSVTWCGNPAQQLIAAAVLNLCGIPIGVYHADLSNSERSELVTKFNTNAKDPMVLICSYYVNSAGTNMQERCRNVHCLCLPMGYPMLHQAIGRVRRLGQKSAVKVYEYHLEKSFDIKQLSNNVSKMLPSLAMQINNVDWNMRLTKGDKDKIVVTLTDTWVQNDDGTVSCLRPAYRPFLSPKLFMSAEQLLKAILKAQTTSAQLIRDATQVPSCVDSFLGAYFTPPLSRITELDDEALAKFLDNNLARWDTKMKEESGNEESEDEDDDLEDEDADLDDEALAKFLDNNLARRDAKMKEDSGSEEFEDEDENVADQEGNGLEGDEDEDLVGF